MSIFTDTMVEAVRKYRTMLRKHLPQAERITHLHRLNLRNPQLFSDEVTLYELGYKIVEHLEQLDSLKNGYYSYSGINQFAAHLKKFLDKYRVDEAYNRVIHTSQLASRFMVKVTQLLTTIDHIDESNKELETCHEMIAQYGSKEQIDLYQTTLQNMIRKHMHERNGPYRLALQNFMRCLEDKRAVA